MVGSNLAIPNLRWFVRSLEQLLVVSQGLLQGQTCKSEQEGRTSAEGICSGGLLCPTLGMLEFVGMEQISHRYRIPFEIHMATWVAPFHTIDPRPPCGGLYKIMPPNSCARYRITAPMPWSESSRKVCMKFSTLKNHNPHLTDRFLIILYDMLKRLWFYHKKSTQRLFLYRIIISQWPSTCLPLRNQSPHVTSTKLTET